MRHHHPLTTTQRRLAAGAGVAFLAVAAGLWWVLGPRWWLVAWVFALAGLHYLREARRGATAARDHPPAPAWVRRLARRAVRLPRRDQE